MRQALVLRHGLTFGCHGFGTPNPCRVSELNKGSEYRTCGTGPRVFCRDVPLVLFLTLFILPGAGPHARADDREAALGVINDAIRADGGEERLARCRIMTRNARGTFFFFGKDVKFTTQLVLEFPDRLRDTIEVEQDNQKVRILRVVTPNGAWTSTAGAAAEMNKPEADELREEMYVLWLTTLMPLKDAAFQLAVLPESKVDGRPAAAIKVSRAGHPDVKLHFDTQTKRLTKLERQAREVGLSVNKEYLFSEPRDFEGVTRATKQIEFAAGKKTTELLVTSFAFPGKVEESTFAKP
jgi:hypothetical protein